MKGTIIMKIRKILAALAATVVAVSSMAVSAFAVEINKDMKSHWTESTIIDAETFSAEFADATPDSVFTLTLEVDESLADKKGHEYWCVKPMINDTGWPFIDTLIGVTLSEGKDTYVVSPGDTYIKFQIPADILETLNETGLAFMGHGVKLLDLTFSNDETLPAAADTAPAAGNVDAATDSSKGSPDTGIADVAAVAGIAILAGGAFIVAKKRK